ncbi:MAG: hypothetical protein PHV85_03225, partial [Desulfovibrionaceae bacterium]|nr:hypothetical protein [Desulfovibrionaceae bacterium]
MTNLLAEKDVREALVGSLLADPVFEDSRAEAVAGYLSTLPPGRGVVLYGCGATARILARRHREVLERAGAVFVSTDEPQENDFHGFARRRASTVPSDAAVVVLLSGSYEQAMRAELAHVDPDRIKGLEQAVALGCNQDLLSRVLGVVVAEAERLAQELLAAFPGQERTICFFDADLTRPYLETYALLRQQGYRLILLSRRFVPSMVPIEDMCAEGWCDFFYQAPSLHFLWLMGYPLAARVRFQVLNVWMLMYTHRNVARIIDRSLSPVVVWHDSFLSQVIEIPAVRELFRTRHELERGEALALEGRIMNGAAGVVHRCPSWQMAEAARRHGSGVPALKFYRPLLPEAAGRGAAKRSKSRALRIIFVCSLHTGPGADPNVAWTLDGIYEAIDKLTGQGVDLAVYNPLDVGGGYEALHELARENPRLTYNSAIHPEELLKVIAGHDFL